MTLNSAQLLKQLQPAVLPSSVASLGAAKPQAALESQSFDQLLALASKGDVHSGRQVELGCDPSPPLNAAQLERLAGAADQAQAAGARNALMLIDGRAFVLDVANRKITAELTDASPPSGVDLAMCVPSRQQSLMDEALKPPGFGVIPAAIAKQFGSATSKIASTA